MRSWKERFPEFASCPIRGVLDHIENKWGTLVIITIAVQPLRFGELSRKIKDISQRMLTQTLRDLQRNGLIDRIVYPVIDNADQLSCRPDFVILVYPAYLEDKGQLTLEIKVSANIPPTLIIHTEDDHAFVQGSKLYHAALDEAKVPNEFQLFPSGGHGYGLRSNKDVKVWLDRCADWLRKIGILK